MLLQEHGFQTFVTVTNRMSGHLATLETIVRKVALLVKHTAQYNHDDRYSQEHKSGQGSSRR